MEKGSNPSSTSAKPSTIPTAQSTATATATATASNSSSSGSSMAVHNSLRQLNKSSYKITKPVSKHHSSSAVGGAGGGSDSGNPGNDKPQPLPLPPPPAAVAAPSNSQQPLPQPPVYNINKNDFREVVQKLTGSPAHQPRLTSPPVAPQREPPKPTAPLAGGGGGGVTSSRLHKIRPPPLAQLTHRPPPPLAPAAAADTLAVGWPRSSPLSPLPPFPTVSAAAESPISAYMRCLQSGSVSHQPALIPSPGSGSQAVPLVPLGPPSPLAFGCMPSPQSMYQMMLSPGLLLPPSPGVPLPSPRWRDQ